MATNTKRNISICLERFYMISKLRICESIADDYSILTIDILNRLFDNPGMLHKAAI